jgi:deazaflavin-dependent oxidoreductase (nitroreductase family)
MMPTGATIVGRVNDRMSRSDLSSKMHRLFYRLTGGRIGGKVRGIPVLLLTTFGRRSKERRTVPLMYLPDGARLLVVASNAANPDRPPGWWFNLQARPDAWARLGGDEHRVRARVLDESERESWWPRLVEHNPNWARFQAETERPFPIVSLQRVPDEENGSGL